MYRAKGAQLFVILQFVSDVFISFISALASYIITLAAVGEGGAPAIESSKLMLGIFTAVLMQSFLFMAANGYLNIQGGAHRYLRTLSLNLPFFMLATLGAYIVSDGGSMRFIYFWIIASFIVSSAMLVLKMAVTSKLMAAIDRYAYSLSRVIIVGDNKESAGKLAKEIARSASSSMMLIGCVSKNPLDVIGCERLGNPSDLENILDKHRPTHVVFAPDSFDRKEIIGLVNLCTDRCVKVYFLPVIYDYFRSVRQIEQIGSIPLINAHANPIDDRLSAAVKRLFDLFGSLLLIFVTLPLMLFVAVGVYLSSPGPILFRQKRVGKMGKEFTMLKFRSMRVNSKSDSAWSNSGDDRKTKFGAFIRRTSLDELPQLFNVLAGQMSLVGPRPEIPYLVDYFKDRIPLYMVKHYVKPGVTGLSQVRGLRGDTSVEKRINTDIEYIENWSLWLDLTILLYTPIRLLNKQERYVKPSHKDIENVTRRAVFPTGDKGKEQELHRVRARKKILYVASTVSHINSFHTEYIEALGRDGYDVYTLARGDGADYNIPFDKSMLSAQNRACRAEIKKIIRGGGFDAIVLNTSLAAFHTRLALSKSDRPRVVNIVHGYLFSQDIPLFRRIILLCAERLVASRTDCIIVMNEEDRKAAIKYKLTRGRVIMCRGMGAKARPILTNPERIRLDTGTEKKFVMAFVGELSERKNQRFLIYAMNEIKEKIPEAELWLIGDGLLENELRELARSVDLTGSVKFFGRREDACDFMRACDLYVSAATVEGMPFNIIEAMGCGKTVLASAVKGHTDIIEEGKSGFLFKYGDTREFVDKAVAIYKGKDRLSVSDIYARYLDYSSERVFPETYRLIKEAIEND